MRRAATNDNYTSISEINSDDEHTKKKRKRNRRSKFKKLQWPISQPPESIPQRLLYNRPPTPFPFLRGDPLPHSQPSPPQLGICSLPNSQSMFTFVAPTIPSSSLQAPQPDNSGLIPLWTEMETATDISQESLLAGDPDWDAEFAKLISITEQSEAGC